jgi:hypothetical protein
MRFIEEQQYFTSGDVGAYVNRNVQTINNWDKYSDILEARGEARLIPKPIRINRQRLFTPSQVKEIKVFTNNFKRGQMAEFNRNLYGKRSEGIKKRAMEREKEREKRQEHEKQQEMVVSLAYLRAVESENRYKNLIGTGKEN